MDKSEIHKNGSTHFTFAGSPTKSKCDNKQYKAITLHNGLRALIISDVKKRNIKQQLSSNSSAVYSSDVVTESSSQTTTGSQHMTSSVLSEDNDFKSFLSVGSFDTFFTVDTQTTYVDGTDSKDVSLKASSTVTSVPLLGEDASYVTDRHSEYLDKEKAAACALTVGVGGFSDPEEIPGLAHFMEHMLFMGNEKYSGENDFDVYISRKGGSTNAVSDCESTTFFFDCPLVYLSDIMERFASLFTAPLFNKDSITKEREIIEAEFNLSLASDAIRVEHLIMSLATDSNPARKFMFGNKKSLQNVMDEILIQQLIVFSQKHYSAHRMTLAVQGNLPISVLESMVSKYFSNIYNNKIPPDNFKNVTVPFKQELFNKIYTAEPIDDMNVLKLTWALPPVVDLYSWKPYSYISYVIGIEGEGSFVSYVRKQLWALDVDVICDTEHGTDNNTIYSIFSIEITLSEQGLSNIKNVIKTLFSYINLLKVTGPVESIYREMQIRGNVFFHYSEAIVPRCNVEVLSKNMQLYPIKHYLTGDHLMFEYNPDVIMKMLNLMLPETVNIVILSRLAAKKEILDKTEPWFDIKYNEKIIPRDWLESWKNAILDEKEFFICDLKPLYKNTDFKLLPIHVHLPNYPENIMNDNYIELWYKQDNEFRIPIGYIYVYMISPDTNILPENKVMIDIFVSLFDLIASNDIDIETTVDGVNYTVLPECFGVFVAVHGYNFKLLDLLKDVLRAIKSFYKSISPDLLEVVKQEQTNIYMNRLLKSCTLAKEIQALTLLSPCWPSVSKLHVIEGMNMQKLKSFMDKFFENLHVKCLIQGNISKNEAIDIANEIKLTIKHKPLVKGSYPFVKAMQLPLGEKYWRLFTMNEGDSHSCVTNYYQFGLYSIENKCLLDLIMLIIKEPLFNTLRTKELLGYAVDCEVTCMFGVLGFSICVQSNANNFSVQYIDKHITNFLETMKNKFKKITDDEFNETRETLILTIKQADSCLKEEVDRNWLEVIRNQCKFDRYKMQIQCVKNIKKQDLYKNYERYLTMNSNLRKLTIQVEGYKSEGNVKPQLQKKQSFSVLPKLALQIESFKKKLFVFPVVPRPNKKSSAH